MIFYFSSFFFCFKSVHNPFGCLGSTWHPLLRIDAYSVASFPASLLTSFFQWQKWDQTEGSEIPPCEGPCNVTPLTSTTELQDSRLCRLNRTPIRPLGMSWNVSEALFWRWRHFVTPKSFTVTHIKPFGIPCAVGSGCGGGPYTSAVLLSMLNIFLVFREFRGIYFGI